jgi:hypothetical protein
MNDPGFGIAASVAELEGELRRTRERAERAEAQVRVLSARDALAHRQPAKPVTVEWEFNGQSHTVKDGGLFLIGLVEAALSKPQPMTIRIQSDPEEER